MYIFFFHNYVRIYDYSKCDFDIAGQYDPMIPDAEVGSFLLLLLLLFILILYFLKNAIFFSKFLIVCGVVERSVGSVGLERIPH